MAPEAKPFLAATILNEGRIVSYRSLSRELKVHSNVAKRMLFDFHQTQNSRKPGTVHATYLLDGVSLPSYELTVNGTQSDGEDVHMRSSPYMSSSMPQEGHDEKRIPTRKVMLAREEDLEAAKSSFEKLHSIHVYSIGPSPVQNLQILSECNREITIKYIGEDPLVAGKQYGIIQNPGVRRRTGKRLVPPPMPAAPAPKTHEKASSKTQDTKPSTQTLKQPDRPSSSGRPSSQSDERPAEKKPTSKPATLKRDRSDIFKSFSKSRAKLAREDTGSSNGASPAPTDRHSDDNSATADHLMKDASEEEDNDDFMETENSKPVKGISRTEREKALRQMMDDDDDGEATDHSFQQPPEASQESEPLDAPDPPKAASPDSPAVTIGGRRRGRRKVVKKKTIKDDEGYLVTKEEPAWESFSEDEPPPPKERTPASTAASSTAKSKKGAGKPGQGNIMSFFGKK